jgi:hypothetical protein
VIFGRTFWFSMRITANKPRGPKTGSRFAAAKLDAESE